MEKMEDSMRRFWRCLCGDFENTIERKEKARSHHFRSPAAAWSGGETMEFPGGNDNYLAITGAAHHFLTGAEVAILG
ncbi:uncharacterized protein LOC107307038 [Coturnix japonica]|uniref:uncharacterized protein LOC107307038 n=1 Tax=Coturnix japonica TaxID=93934 RepID=UPI000776CF8F|nr:uncharacterized protein LOC107307038 [Coturnix japonica]